MGAVAEVDHEVEVHRAAASERHRRAVASHAWAVGGDQHVGGKPTSVGVDQLCQPHRAGFLAHLDQVRGVEPEGTASGVRERAQRCHVDRVLRLVVGCAAAVEAVAVAGQLPRPVAARPRMILPDDHVTVPVAQHCR